MPIHHLSLCAGIGGIDLGLRRVVGNIRTVAMVEREAFCCANLVKAMEEGELILALSTRTYSGSLGRSIEEWWTSSLAASHVSLSVRRGTCKSTEDDRHLWPHIKAGLAVLRPLESASSRTSKESQQPSHPDTTPFCTMS